MTKSWKATACAVLAALALSGCSAGAGEVSGRGKTITEDEAAEKVQEHISGVMSALPGEAELETRHGMKSAACDDPTDGGPKERVTVSERLWIRGLPVEDNESNIALMHDYWVANGYEVVHDLRPDELFVTVVNEEDSFNVSVRTSDEGSLAIGATSPCVWPDGEPSS